MSSNVATTLLLTDRVRLTPRMRLLAPACKVPLPAKVIFVRPATALPSAASLATCNVPALMIVLPKVSSALDSRTVPGPPPIARLAEAIGFTMVRTPPPPPSRVTPAIGVIEPLNATLPMAPR